VQNISKQAVDYYWRMEVFPLSIQGSDRLARHAYEEQKTLYRLPWFESMHALCSAKTKRGSYHDIENGNAVREEFEHRFRAQWEKTHQK
jgi:hypothetical protein